MILLLLARLLRTMRGSLRNQEWSHVACLLPVWTVSRGEEEGLEKLAWLPVLSGSAGSEAWQLLTEVPEETHPF